MESFKLTADELMEKDPELAIIPVGSLEQHGPHLPLMTDWAIATELGRRVAELTGGYLLPALPISTCREQMGKKGSVWMEPPTFYQMMTDIVMCLKLQGFKRVVILPCHGGIFILTPIVRDLNAKYNPDLQVALIDYGIFSGKLYQEGINETNTELHAGEGETSMMLAIAPETVHMDRAVDFVPTYSRPYLNFGSLLQICPDGVWGEATCATAEKGEKMLQRYAELIVEEMHNIFRFMEQKKKINYSNF